MESLFWAHSFRGLGPTMAGMTGSRCGCWSWKLKAEESYLEPRTGRRVSRLEIGRIFQLSKATPTDVLPIERPHLLSLSNSATNQGPSIQTSEPKVNIPIQAITYAKNLLMASYRT